MGQSRLLHFSLTALAATIAVFVWFVAGLAINLVLTYFFSDRGDFILWIIRNLVSPGVAAGFSLSVARRMVSSVDARNQAIAFSLLVVLASIAGTLNNYQVYAEAGRFEEWRQVLLSGVCYAVVAVVAAFYFARNND